MKRPDCIVVGAGILGLTIAYRLVRRGLGVRVMTARRPDASLAAAGMLAPGIEAAEVALTQVGHPRLGAFLQEAAQRWPAFAAEICGDPADWRAIGYRPLDTLLAMDDADSSHLSALAKAAVEFGAPGSVLSGGAARRLEPALSPSVTQALHFPGDALVEPLLLLGVLRDALRSADVEIEIARITAVSQADGVVRLQSAAGETLEAESAVLAAGWPGAVNLAPEFAHVVPIKGQIATLSGRSALRTMLRGPGIYLAPRADGRIECGATSERGVDTLTLEPAAIQSLRDRAARLAPALVDSWAIGSRVGVRPSTPDYAPILGASALGERVHLAAGPHRNGVLLAPLLADIVADGIIGGTKAGDWQRALSAARFEP